MLKKMRQRGERMKETTVVYTAVIPDEAASNQPTNRNHHHDDFQNENVEICNGGTTSAATTTTGTTTTTTLTPLVVPIAFGCVGLFNNIAYVIMLANAKYISEGGVAAVYIANIVPGLMVQLTAPYWFDTISYRVRLRIAAMAMAIAFLIVSYFSYHSITTTTTTTPHLFQNNNNNNNNNTDVVLFGQLFGVAMISFQCGLGEASLLALAGKWDSAGRSTSHNSQHHHPHQESAATTATNKAHGNCLSSFAMGTGIAGPMGFLWKIAWNEWFGFSVSESLLMAAIVLSTSYGYICTQLVCWSCDMDGTPATTAIPLVPTTATCTDDRYEVVRTESETGRDDELDGVTTTETTNDDVLHSNHLSPFSESEELVADGADSADGLLRDERLSDQSCPVPLLLPALTDMSALDRCRLLFRMCWPYMVPLFVVYAAEYACQAGAWTTIGFPTVTSAESRIQFFERSNWLYQAGVFISRSTGSLLSINIIGLWIMPAIQVLNLVVFSVTASTGVHVPRGIFYHQSTLLSLSFFTGLLGGAVYVHGYNRIVRDVPKQYTEFAVASTSVAVSFGVLVADIIGLYLQSCLYKNNGLDGAVVQCPF